MENDMFVSFLSNDKAVIAPLASVHFTVTGAEGFTAFVAGIKYHPVDPRTIAAHELGALSKTVIELAERARLSAYTRA
jgi:hypothetical protein